VETGVPKFPDVTCDTRVSDEYYYTLPAVSGGTLTGDGTVLAGTETTTHNGTQTFSWQLTSRPDGDSDGVPDDTDTCPRTPLLTPVDASGCPVPAADEDGDGVPDDTDLCPATPPSTPVDASGCPLPPADEDRDGVPDDEDLCPATPPSTPVDASGCPLPPTADFDAAELTVEKSANGAVTRTFGWTHTKSGDPTSSSGGPGSVHNWGWLLDSTRDGGTLSGWAVSGTAVLVNSSTLVPMTITSLTDSIAGATFTNCDVPLDIPADDSVTCDYTATGAANVLSNTTSAAGYYTIPPGYRNAGRQVPVSGNDTATFTYTEAEAAASAQLVDVYLGMNETLHGTNAQSLPGTYSCPAATSNLYINGTYTKIIQNESSLTPDGGTALRGSATVTISCTVPQLQAETAWAANGHVPLQLRYNPDGGSNWATYVQYEGAKATTLFAGRTIPVGTVHFSAASSKKVTITVTMNSEWAFGAVEETLKMQGYSKAPSGNPNPGSFEHKKTCDEGSKTCSIVVPKNNFYGVHVEVIK
jgi:hypothetical protein